MTVRLRPMTAEDVVPVRELTARAFDALAECSDRPLTRAQVGQHPEGQLHAAQEWRLRRLLDTDPDGAWVAVEEGRCIGVALAAVREWLWYLSLLAVDPEHQERGIGRALLDASLRTAGRATAGVVLSSEDPRAVRLYATAGFHLHPAVQGVGDVRHADLPDHGDVSEGTAEHVELLDDVDRAVRGGLAHGQDVVGLLDHGGTLLLADGQHGRGYAVARSDSALVLAATDRATAQRLLWACLARAEDGGQARVPFLTAEQDWAVEAVLAAGLRIESAGPVFTRGGVGIWSPYLPSGAWL